MMKRGGGLGGEPWDHRLRKVAFRLWNEWPCANLGFQFTMQFMAHDRPPWNWERWLPVITALAVAVTPIGVAIIASKATRSGTDKDYVTFAVSVINSEKSTPAMKNWATSVLNKLSPIPLEGQAAEDLAKIGVVAQSRVGPSFPNPPASLMAPVKMPSFIGHQDKPERIIH